MQQGDKSPSEGTSSTKEYSVLQKINNSLSGTSGMECNVYMNNLMFGDKVVEDKDLIQNQLADQQRQGNVGNVFEQDYQNRVEFVNSDEFSNFSEMLVISQIRNDFSNDEPFLSHIFNVHKAIHKAIRNLLIKSHRCLSKEAFIEIQSQMFRSFCQDISIGFITSTGQLKSTAYIYVNIGIVEIINQQQQHLIFKKQQLQITTFFSSIDALSKSQSLGSSDKTPKDMGISLSSFANILGQDKKEDNNNQIPVENCGVLGKKSELMSDMNSSINIDYACSSKKMSIVPSPNRVWLKQAFIRTDKFRNEFIQIQKPQDEELKFGISIHFVYRPMDDQIYAVKKSCLITQDLTFYDVFSTMYLQDMTQDHRKIREAKILSKLNHPNVLRLYDWWVEEERTGSFALYMQLEYCSFPGFKNQTNDLLNFAYYYLNPMANLEKVENIKIIMNQVVDGLEYIHNRGIVHRDLKPENIFVSITTSGELQVMLADFDQGKDVRELKLSVINEEKISEFDLNSIKSRNTIKSGTSGYQTPNSSKDRPYDQCDEFYALGVTLLHMILTFSGEPKNRNHYATTFGMSDIEDVLSLFDIWSNKFVKNKNKEFTFASFTAQLILAKNLIDNRVKTHEEIRQIIKLW